MRSFGPSDFVLVLSETVLVIVIEKQLWLTNWVLDPCGIFNSLVAQTRYALAAITGSSKEFLGSNWHVVVMGLTKSLRNTRSQPIKSTCNSWGQFC
jgi:hypothetical protein